MSQDYSSSSGAQRCPQIGQPWKTPECSTPIITNNNILSWSLHIKHFNINNTEYDLTNHLLGTSFTSLNSFPSDLALPITLTSSNSSLNLSYLFSLSVLSYWHVMYEWVLEWRPKESYYFSKLTFILYNVFFLKSERFLWLYKNKEFSERLGARFTHSNKVIFRNWKSLTLIFAWIAEPLNRVTQIDCWKSPAPTVASVIH